MLQAALRTGFTYDLLEPGVYAIAVRNSDRDDPKENLRAALTRLKDDIFALAPGLKWGKASTWDLATKSAGAPLYPPMLLWPIAPDLAARLVAGELLLIGFIRKDVWASLFTRHGIEREIDDDGNWWLRRAGGVVTFSNVEVAKITAGVVFSGIGPTAVADAADADLTGQAAASAEPE